MDPYATGVYIFLGKTGTTICPVAAILSVLTVRPRHLTGPLLQHSNGSTLTSYTLVTQVKQALAAAGHDPHHYSGHSFRIVAATAAAQAGIPDHQIKMLG